MRNFYLEANIDGRKTALNGGPRSKEGGMTISLAVNDNGNSNRIINIYCTERNGELFVDVRHAGKSIFLKQYKRKD